MSKRIAPTLTAIVERKSGWLRHLTTGNAAGELRALLAVARAAKRVKPYTEGWADRCDRIWDALDRLDKASAPPKGT